MEVLHVVKEISSRGFNELFLKRHFFLRKNYEERNIKRMHAKCRTRMDIYLWENYSLEKCVKKQAFLSIPKLKLATMLRVLFRVCLSSYQIQCHSKKHLTQTARVRNPLLEMILRPLVNCHLMRQGSASLGLH